MAEQGHLGDVVELHFHSLCIRTAVMTRGSSGRCN
jgi:hypothetical protein